MKSCDAPSPRICAVVLCAGSGTRTGLCYNKILHYFGKKTLLETTLDTFAGSCVHDIVLVCAPQDREKIGEIAARYENVRLCDGGETRTESVRCGLRAAEGCDIVVIHDGARPYVTPDLIRRTVESALRFGSGIAAVPAVDTIKEAEDGCVTQSLPREKLWCMQTPQTFSYPLIRAAYESACDAATDDGEIFARAGHTPHIVRGEYENVKVTTANDLFRGLPFRTKVGVGFDVHPLKEGRALVLGGVTVPHGKGLDGHSDADVLTHAVMDALLGAAGLPDIGVLFPDTDKSTEGISSLLLLDRVAQAVAKEGYTVGNVSATVMAQKPKLAPFIPAMRETLAARLHIDPRQMNISAGTTERLGIVGEEKGMAASACCLLFY